MSSKPKKKRPGRKPIGPPISITLTPEQRDWLISLIEPGGTLTGVVRRLVQTAMDASSFPFRR